MAFSPLPPTQFDNDEEEDLEPRTKTKVRQLIDDDDDQDEEEEEEEDNEELVDYKKQLFEMEAEESGETKTFSFCCFFYYSKNVFFRK